MGLRDRLDKEKTGCVTVGQSAGQITQPVKVGGLRTGFTLCELTGEGPTVQAISSRDSAGSSHNLHRSIHRTPMDKSPMVV